jgi:hypothetical protein
MTDVFNSGNDNGQNSETDTNSENLFDKMVGDGKQYSSASELAKGKQEADSFIDQLKEENKQLREDLGKRLTSEEILNQIKNSSNGDPSATTEGLTKEQIEELVKGTITSVNNDNVDKNNLAQANQMVVDKYGEKATEYVANRAKELGLTVKELEDTAKRSPAAFSKLIGLDKDPTNNSNSVTGGGSINTQALNSHNNTGIKVGSYKYYEQLRKDNPRKYFSPEIQNEMFRNRKEHGEEFYS